MGLAPILHDQLTGATCSRPERVLVLGIGGGPPGSALVCLLFISGYIMESIYSSSASNTGTGDKLIVTTQF